MYVLLQAAPQPRQQPQKDNEWDHHCSAGESFSTPSLSEEGIQYNTDDLEGSFRNSTTPKLPQTYILGRCWMYYKTKHISGFCQRNCVMTNLSNANEVDNKKKIVTHNYLCFMTFVDLRRPWLEI